MLVLPFTRLFRSEKLCMYTMSNYVFVSIVVCENRPWEPVPSLVSLTTCSIAASTSGRTFLSKGWILKTMGLSHHDLSTLPRQSCTVRTQTLIVTLDIETYFAHASSNLLLSPRLLYIIQRASYFPVRLRTGSISPSTTWLGSCSKV